MSSYFMDELILYMILYGIPAMTVIWFVVMLILFLKAKKAGAPRKKAFLVLTIVSGALSFLLVSAVVVLHVLIFLSIRHM